MSLMLPRGSGGYQGSHFGKPFGSDDPDGSRQPSVSRQINPRTLLPSATLGKLPRMQFQQSPAKSLCQVLALLVSESNHFAASRCFRSVYSEGTIS
jgi:hypothetical protein